MDIGASKQISEEEKNQISKQVQADLVEHLYEGCLPGTFTGIGCSIAFFLMFYQFTPTALLISWVVIFDIMMCLLTALYFFYLRYKKKMELFILGNILFGGYVLMRTFLDSVSFSNAR